MENDEPSRTSRRQNCAPPIRESRLFLFLSLTLNLGLVVFLVWAYQHPSSTAIPELSPTGHPANESRRSAGTQINPVATRVAAVNSPWRQLESSDLSVYAANLRAAGCPEKTVRDILLPALEENFEHAKPIVSEPTNFWASFSERKAVATARAEQERALQQQKEETLKELFGFVWLSEGLRSAYSVETAHSIGFLDYDHAEKFLCTSERFKKQFARADLSHRFDRRVTIYQAWLQEVGEALSPSELEETELREIFLVCERRDQKLSGAGLSGSELRQLMAFRRELCNPLPSTLLAESDDLFGETDWVGEQKFYAKARELLGESRFLDYLKSCDVGIDRTIATLEKEHLPTSLALQLFDLRQEAMARAQEIRQLPVRRADKRLRIAALRQSALEQLASLSNGETDTALIRINQDWLQEIANP